MIKHLDFKPLKGLASPHLQMAFAIYSPCGQAPEASTMRITLTDGDQLSSEVSTPSKWHPSHPTVALVHGLGGSHNSKYMIRLARKFYLRGCKVVRINLRGCGSGEGLAERPYYSGNSEDIAEVLAHLKNQAPHSPITLIGFSMSGNIILKMAGELGEKGSTLVHHLMAICPVLDIANCQVRMTHHHNWLYHKYYLRNMHRQGKKWLNNKTFSTIHEFNDKIVAPLWGYANADDYYEKCSSAKFIPSIKIPCDLIFASDDPFIDYKVVKRVNLPESTHAWLTTHGGHLGFIGRSSQPENGVYWLDDILLNWRSFQLKENAC
jgi:uncharacterized protein